MGFPFFTNYPVLVDESLRHLNHWSGILRVKLDRERQIQDWLNQLTMLPN